eukprot:9486813-Alexandrium_andersonii.AAC.2
MPTGRTWTAARTSGHRQARRLGAEAVGTPRLSRCRGPGASQRRCALALSAAVGALPHPRGAAAPQRTLTISDVARAMPARLRGAASPQRALSRGAASAQRALLAAGARCTHVVDLLM